MMIDENCVIIGIIHMIDKENTEKSKNKTFLIYGGSHTQYSLKAMLWHSQGCSKVFITGQAKLHPQYYGIAHV